MPTATGSSTRVGLSWEGPHGIWEKATTEAHWDEFPEALALADRQRNLYVTCRLHQRLLDMRVLRGGMTVESYNQESWQLDQLAIGYLNPSPEATP